MRILVTMVHHRFRDLARVLGTILEERRIELALFSLRVAAVQLHPAASYQKPQALLSIGAIREPRGIVLAMIVLRKSCTS